MGHLNDPIDSHGEEVGIYSLTSIIGRISTCSMKYMLRWSSLLKKERMSKLSTPSRSWSSRQFKRLTRVSYSLATLSAKLKKMHLA